MDQESINVEHVVNNFILSTKAINHSIKFDTSALSRHLSEIDNLLPHQRKEVKQALSTYREQDFKLDYIPIKFDFKAMAIGELAGYQKEE